MSAGDWWTAVSCPWTGCERLALAPADRPIGCRQGGRRDSTPRRAPAPGGGPARNQMSGPPRGLAGVSRAGGAFCTQQ